MDTERRLLALAFFVGLCFCAAALGYVVNDEAFPGWYAALEKPAWTAPGWLFGPVWAALYLMMAVAAWLVWDRAGWKGARGALLLFAAQLALNAAWSPAFFGLRRPDLGFLVLALLWVTLGATTVAFFRVGRLPGLLLVPYLGWVTYALALNFAIWRLNA